MSLSANLQRLLNIHRISVTELSKKTNVPQPVLHRLVTGQTPNPTVFTLDPIAKFFSVSMDQLVANKSIDIKKISKIKTIIQTTRAKTKIPLINWKQAINWKTSIKNSVKKSISIDEEYYSDKLYALDINEYKYSANNQPFPEKTIIIVDPTLNPDNNDYILIYKKTSEYPYLAKYIKEKNGYFIKQLDNQFIIRKISNDEKIIGIVIQSKTNYRK